ARAIRAEAARAETAGGAGYEHHSAKVLGVYFWPHQQPQDFQGGHEVDIEDLLRRAPIEQAQRLDLERARAVNEILDRELIHAQQRLERALDVITAAQIEIP